MSQSYEIDMCHGPLFGKIIRFSIPLMLSGIFTTCCLMQQILLWLADLSAVRHWLQWDPPVH